jgi:hypothetical protein
MVKIFNLLESTCLIRNLYKIVYSKIYFELNGCRLENLKNVKLVICENCENIEILTTRLGLLSVNLII